MSKPLATARQAPGSQRLPSYSVVLTTTGLPGLEGVIQSVLGAVGQPPLELIIVDNRPIKAASAELDLPAEPKWKFEIPIRVLPCVGGDPAAARNVGWLAASSDWVVFLDEGVVVSSDWAQHLVEDIAACADAVVVGRVCGVSPAGPSARVRHDPVPWWSGGDIACRRSTLYEVGGFDETFLGSGREMGDLVLRILNAGYETRIGERRSRRPLNPDGAAIPLPVQRRERADDAVMLARHGYRWRRRAAVGRSDIPIQLAIAAAAASSLAAAATRHRALAAVAGTFWGVLVAAEAVSGARTTVDHRQPAAMIINAAAISPVVLYHRLRGEVRARLGAAAQPRYATIPNPAAQTTAGRHVR